MTHDNQNPPPPAPKARPGEVRLRAAESGWGPVLVRARFVARHKRYTVHATGLDGALAGQEISAHLGDPGRLEGLLEPGAVLWLSGPYPTPPRKLAWSVRLVETKSPSDGRTVCVGLDSTLANRVVPELIGLGALPALPGPETLRREVRLPAGEGRTTRIDLAWPHEGDLHLCEIKTVGHISRPGVASWPDAPSARGRRHVAHLTHHVRQGHRATLVFVASREDVARITANAAIDPDFASALAEAADAGVELLGVRLRLTPGGIFFTGTVPVEP